MAQGGEQDDDTVSLTASNSMVALTLNPLCDASPLPIEMVEEIICRLPVKLLSQLRCVCKSWNSLISDSKFARRHLRRSNRHILLVRLTDHSRDIQFVSYPLPSVLKATATGGKLDSPLLYGNHEYSIISSCDGMVCCRARGISPGPFVAWNPSIRKFWKLAPFKKPRLEFYSYGFGYDHLSQSYKLVVILYYYQQLHYPLNYKTHVMVHTLGSNSWRRIGDFPGLTRLASCGKFVSGTVNWLACDGYLCPTRGIISLDLGNESYQEFLQPDYGIDQIHNLILDVMRDCLCILVSFSDVWIMKEYGNNESWTKLFSFADNSILRFPYYRVKNRLSVCEDDETLYHSTRNLGMYNHKNGTFRSFHLENLPGLIHEIYVENESLISPYP